MFRIKLLAVVLGVVAIALVAAPRANGQLCRSSAHCYMVTDISGTQTDGPYDPCYNDINWTIEFYRTNKDNTTLTVLQWLIEKQQGGYYILRQYRSDEWQREQWHTSVGTASLGPSTWHKLRLQKYTGPGGHFNQIDLGVTYVAGSPTSPGDE